MDENPNDTESLIARIQQLEHERDGLRKDIEQLCIQQAGPSYLVVATKMHFQRTASLEQEIESLKKKLSTITRENINLQEELSEAYRIKSQLADLHGAELSKNMEAEKQLKFFQSCVAAAFAERDNAIMEAEKAKEKEELVSQKLSDLQNRLEDLASSCFEEKKLNDTLRMELTKQEEQNENFKRVANKFYEIRQTTVEGFEESSWDDKCTSLLNDPGEMWSYRNDMETSTSQYISTLEDELESLRKTMDCLQNKLKMGLEIENHLRKTVAESENKKILLLKRVQDAISGFSHYHSQHRVHISSILNEGNAHIKSIIDMAEEKFMQLKMSTEQNLNPLGDVSLDANKCQDLHRRFDHFSNVVVERNESTLPSIVADRTADSSKALTQALQEKVAALLLLSQQEERHLLERNVNATLQKKIEELQRNLLQVTNEKVKALMELAQLKQEFQILQEKFDCGSEQEKPLPDIGGKRAINSEKDGKLRNLLKKTYLRRWIGTDFSGAGIGAQSNNEGIKKSSSDMDFARMRIENATLKESLYSIEHLTSSVHRLRLSLVKAKESISIEGSITNESESLEDIISEAKLVKTALSSSLPVSWSAEVADIGSSDEYISNEHICGEKIDSVSAAGFEMVELLILAVQILMDSTTKS